MPVYGLRKAQGIHVNGEMFLDFCLDDLLLEMSAFDETFHQEVLV